MVATVSADPVLTLGEPRVLFEGRFENLPWAANYDVTADGQRFLMIQAAAETATAVSQIQVVLNWFEELRRRVPAAK